MAFQREKPVKIGVKAPFPGFVDPALATAVDTVPNGERWIHEIKFDGYRVQVHLRERGHQGLHPARQRLDQALQEDRRRRLAYQRRLRDHRRRNRGAGGGRHHRLFRPAKRAEGQVEQDRPGRLRPALSQRPRPAEAAAGRSARRMLKKMIDGTDVQFSESFEIDGREMFAHACKVGLEGVVSKVRDSRYFSGRGNDWVKETCAQRETLTIAGFALDGNDWDGIYLGRRKGNDLVYAGKVDHGFDKTSAAELRKRLTPLIRKTQPYTKRIAHQGIWVEPELLAEIEYRAKSAEGKVRHPFFKGLREDL